jgi:signal peptidase II
VADPRRRALTRAALVCAVVVALDQLTKHTLGTWLRPNQVRHVIPGLELVYERNTGVAFSFLTGTGALVYAVTALALIALVALLLMRPTRRLLWLPIGMFAGGAAGNLIDRVSRGAVIDFIQLPHWPAFNIADSCITLGVIILVLVAERG